MNKFFARFAIVAALISITSFASAEAPTIVVTHGTLQEWKSNHEPKETPPVNLGKRNSPSKRERIVPRANVTPITLGS